MQAEAVFAESVGLGELRRKIEEWRQKRPKTRPMPEELWNEAGAAARQLGVGRTSRALRLNYRALKQRVARGDPGQSVHGGDKRKGPVPQRTEFVELSGFPTLAEAATGGETVVEVVAADGTRLTIRVKGAHANVAALVSAFRGRS